MTARGTPSAQDGYTYYCKSYDEGQKRLQPAVVVAMHPGDIGCTETKCQRGRGDPPADCIWPDCPCGVYYAPEYWAMYYVQFATTGYFVPENCSGHVAMRAKPKICARCGVNIDSLRLEEDE